MSDEYTCALSGRTPDTDQKAPLESSDELEDLPIGWSKVSIQTRVLNPDFVKIQAVKDSIINEFLSNVPDENKDEAKELFQIQVAAQFAALESQISPYLIDERICYISDATDSEVVKEEWDSLLERLDLAE